MYTPKTKLALQEGIIKMRRESYVINFHCTHVFTLFLCLFQDRISFSFVKYCLYFRINNYCHSVLLLSTILVITMGPNCKQHYDFVNI